MSLPDNSHSTCLSSWEEVAGSLFPGTGCLATDLRTVRSTRWGVRTVLLQEKIVRSPVPVYTLCHLHHPGLAGFHCGDQQGFLSICPFAFLLGESQATGTKSSPSIWLCSQVSLETRPASFCGTCACAEHCYGSSSLSCNVLSADQKSSSFRWFRAPSPGGHLSKIVPHEPPESRQMSAGFNWEIFKV